jgi:8-oxo-dGTP pyrophosphatase MutT (NUDIX family)
MELNGKDVYFVAVKLLLRDGGNLLVTHDIFGDWDLPGGRIKKDEFQKPLEQVMERKVREELGADIKYSLGEPKVFFRVERLENSINQPVRIFAVGYEAHYIGGHIDVGEHHDEYRWVNIQDFDPASLFSGGWLAGVQDYIDKVCVR